MALKKAAEMLLVGDEVAGKGHSWRKEQPGQRQGGVNSGRLVHGAAHSSCAVWLGPRVCQQEKVVTLESARGQLAEGCQRQAKELGPWPAAR